MSDNSNVWRKLRVEEKKRKWIQERETKCKRDFSFISYFNLSKWTMLAPKKMDRRNSTLVTEFVLLGLTDRPDLQPILFVLFLGISLITVGGNLGMLLLIRIDSCLHTPMYFFLASLSCLDLWYSTNVTPKMLVNLSERKQTNKHFLYCLLNSVLFFHCHGDYWILHASCDGLWQVHGHL